MSGSGLGFVELLAQALDNDNYQAATAVLAGNVVYQIGDELLRGPADVIASYRQASEMAHRVFDQVEYGHEIISTSESHTYRVRYSDILTSGDDTHTHFAEQLITVDEELGVIHIVHVPDAEERRKVDAFMARNGLSREETG